jgi:hypothetical protein
MRHYSFFFLLLLSFFLGCAGSLRNKGLPEGKEILPKSLFTLTEISAGLPREGLWRQNVALHDVNGDGFPDIIAPPPRLAKPEDRKPSIFLRNEENSDWRKGNYRFPDIGDYDYGGIAAGDVNGDGFLDIAMATHVGRIIILLNDGRDGFIESPFETPVEFHSRTVRLEDMDNDGWIDIVAFSEGPFRPPQLPKGVLFGRNLNGNGWDITLLKDSFRVSGDSLDIADIDGDGINDVVLAPRVGAANYKKLVWFGGGGGFDKIYTADEKDFYRIIPFLVRSGDIDGDGKLEILFLNSGIGKGATTDVNTYRWEEDRMTEVAEAVEVEKQPLRFTLYDLDGDADEELILLSMSGFHIFDFLSSRWNEVFFRELDFEKELNGVYEVTAGMTSGGSILVVYNGGNSTSVFQGIRAFTIQKYTEIP